MKVKLVVSAILAFWVVIFVSQNTEIVQVTFMAWSVEISLLLLIFIVFGFGIMIGWLLNSYFRFVRQRKKQPVQPPVVPEKAKPVANDEAKTPVEEREEV